MDEPEVSSGTVTEEGLGWEVWHERLRKKWVWWSHMKWPDVPAMTQDRMREYVDQIEREFAPEVDQVILKFAENGRWPRGHNEHGYFISRRIEHALELIVTLRTPVFQDHRILYVVPDSRQPDLIVARWLLIDTWQAFGKAKWEQKFLLGLSK